MTDFYYVTTLVSFIAWIGASILLAKIYAVGKEPYFILYFRISSPKSNNELRDRYNGYLTSLWLCEIISGFIFAVSLLTIIKS